MKVKRFKNIWAMGLIIFLSILVFMYLIKLIFPEFVVGIAQTKHLVDLGNYIDTHKWAYYLFYTATSMFGMYFLTCAACRVKKLSYKSIVVILAMILLSYIVAWLTPQYLTYYNYINNIFLPVIAYKIERVENEKVVYSIGTCYIINIVAQVLSLEIRGISTMITYPNAATYFCQ